MASKYPTGFCVVPGCQKPRKGRGYCAMHWERWRRYGSADVVRKRSSLRGAAHPNFKHGCHAHPLFQIWRAMMFRCYNLADKSFKNYGARGIAVAIEWHDPRTFLADMAPRPDGMWLERRDNDGDYCRANCVWASKFDQARNRRSTVLNPQIVRTIRDLRKAGTSLKAVSEQTGIGLESVKAVLYRKQWADIT